MEPKISIVMPVFNGAQWLEEAIGSLRCQSLQDFELIVIDDGSTDQTGRIIERAAGFDARIRFLRQLHSGVSEASNRGIALARAPLIARMDADDIAAPARLNIAAWGTNQCRDPQG